MNSLGCNCTNCSMTHHQTDSSTLNDKEVSQSDNEELSATSPSLHSPLSEILKNLRKICMEIHIEYTVTITVMTSARQI